MLKRKTISSKVSSLTFYTSNTFKKVITSSKTIQTQKSKKIIDYLKNENKRLKRNVKTLLKVVIIYNTLL